MKSSRPGRSLKASARRCRGSLVGRDPARLRPRRTPPRPPASSRPEGRRAGGAKVISGEGDPMATARLRVFPRPEDEAPEAMHAPAIPIRLVDLYPLLAQAYRDNYVWLRDFEDDEL